MNLNNIDISKLPADIRKQYKKIAGHACREADTE